jgi:hypothetical protein
MSKRHERQRRQAARVLAGLLAALLSGCSTSSGGGGPTFAGAFTASSGTLKAGAATVPIVLPPGTALAGHGGPPRRPLDGSILLTGGPLSPLGCLDPDPSTAAVFFAPNAGVIDQLTARALVLDNGARRLAIVKVDAIGMSRTLRDAVADAAVPLGIPRPHVAVVATHTHAGPGGVSDQPAWEIAASDCFSQAVYDAVKSAAVLALSQAQAALTPAKLGIGSVQVTGFTRNRRDEVYPPGAAPLDVELGLIKVETTGGVPIAALINFAIHGTFHDGDNMKVSADAPGAIEDEIEKVLPAGAVAIFTNGAEGDVAPQKSATITTPEALGAGVAAKVAALWSTTVAQPTADLRVVFTDVAMPPPQYNPLGCLPLAETTTTVCDLGVQPTVPLPTWLSTALPFQAIRINDTVLVAVPGEPVTELGITIKQQAVAAGLARGYVVALANDHGGYFTTTVQYDKPTYEGQATLYGRDTGATVVEATAVVIEKVK